MQQQSKDKKASNSSTVIKGKFNQKPPFGFNQGISSFKPNTRMGSINRGRR